jgi:copper transport protein
VVDLGCVVPHRFTGASPASPLWAHAKLLESIPAGGDVLANPPKQVSLRFDEPVRFEEPKGAGVDLLDPIKVYNEEGERVDEGTTRASSDDTKILVVDLKKLSDGVYGVDWEVTSKDGHVIDGALGFTVERSRMSSESAADTKAKRDEGASLGTILAASVAILAIVGLAFFGVLRRR